MARLEGCRAHVHSSLPFNCVWLLPPVQPSAPDLKIELTEEERERADELDEAALRRQVSVASGVQQQQQSGRG